MGDLKYIFVAGWRGRAQQISLLKVQLQKAKCATLKPEVGEVKRDKDGEGDQMSQRSETGLLKLTECNILEIISISFFGRGPCAKLTVKTGSQFVTVLIYRVCLFTTAKQY